MNMLYNFQLLSEPESPVSLKQQNHRLETKLGTLMLSIHSILINDCILLFTRRRNSGATDVGTVLCASGCLK